MEEEDEYARWTREAGAGDQSAPREGPAAGLAHYGQQRRLKRSANDGDDDDDMDLDEEERGPQRNYNAKDSRYQAHHQERHQGSRSSQERPEREDGQDRALADTNIGHQMLLKLGWAGTGTGLGSNAQGRSQPLSLSFAKHGADQSGIGKLRSTSLALDDAMSLSKLHTLNSERIATETVEERTQREADNRSKEKIRAEVQATLSVFRCDICGGKQYENASQMSEHLNSYAHHHRKRLKELASNQRALLSAGGGGAGGGSAGEKRREKERKREEREMRAFAEAAGIQLASQVPSSSAPSRPAAAWSSPQTPALPKASTITAAPVANVSSTTSAGSGGGGWKKISSSSSSGGGFRKIGSTSTSSTVLDSTLAHSASGSSIGAGSSSQGSLQPPTTDSTTNPPPRTTSSGFRPIQSGAGSVTQSLGGSNQPAASGPPPPPPPIPPPHLGLTHPNPTHNVSATSQPSISNFSSANPLPSASRSRKQYPTFRSGGY